MLHFSKLGDHAIPLAHIVGFIPHFLDEADPRPAAEQIEDRYGRIGSGWLPIQRFALRPDGSIKYPSDRAMQPLATATLRDEILYVYESGWVAIVQPNGSFEVSRLD